MLSKRVQFFEDFGNQYRVLSGFILVLIYAIVVTGLYEIVGPGIYSLTFFPVAILTSKLGMYRGFVAALFFSPLNILLTILAGVVFEDFFNIIFIFSHIILAFAGGMSGYLGDLRSELKIQLKARQAAVEEMQETDQRYRALFDGTNDAVFILSLEMVYIAVNQRAAEMLGYTVDEVIGMRVERLIMPEEWEQMAKRGAQIVTEESLPLYERVFRHKDCRPVYTEVNAMLVLDAEEQPLYIQSVVRDITERKEFERQQLYLATHDALTGLPNRRLFVDLANQALKRAKRNQYQAAVLFLDVDGFKLVNDTHGHENGDLFLQELAKQLQGAVRTSDVVARLAGDEFVFLLDNILEKTVAARVAQKILGAVSRGMFAFQIDVTGSLGISIYPDDGEDIVSLLRNADQAMYKIKQTTKNNFEFYSEDEEE